jgi:hypothetical protein
MELKKYYYIFDSEDKYIDTATIEELAKFLHKTVRSVKVNMTRNKKRKYCILKNDKEIEYKIRNEKQFFGSRNVK